LSAYEGLTKPMDRKRIVSSFFINKRRLNWIKE
jgi:hypothetical protein